MKPGNDRGRPAANQTAPKMSNGDEKILSGTNFEVGILADAYRDGKRRWLLKRAADFERAKPRAGEFHGGATREELSTRWSFCDRVATAFRNKAEALAIGQDDEFDELLADCLRWERSR